MIIVLPCLCRMGTASMIFSIAAACISSLLKSSMLSPRTTVNRSHPGSSSATAQLVSIASRKRPAAISGWLSSLPNPQAVNCVAVISCWRSRSASRAMSLFSCGQNSIAGKPSSAAAVIRSWSGPRNHISMFTANCVCRVWPGMDASGSGCCCAGLASVAPGSAPRIAVAATKSRRETLTVEFPAAP